MDGGGSGAAPYGARSAEEVFRDYRARRAGMIKALTTDVDKFFKLCDPGINFARDGMNEKDWLALVAVHSDSWLLSVAFYFGARFGFDKEARRRLFSMINNMPTIFEVVTGSAKKQTKEKTPNSSSKSNKPSSKVQSRAESRSKAKVPKDEDESGDDDGDEEAEEHDNTLCGTCGTNDGKDQFWICCDNCEKWYHGKCVKITPARAEHIKQYKCPDCTNKRARA
nr:unnamed protein product [Digitaria exilis]